VSDVFRSLPPQAAAVGARRTLFSAMDVARAEDPEPSPAAPASCGSRFLWYARLLRESPRLLLQVLNDARRAADLICPEDPQDARGKLVN
jgi:hypothetical protein